MPSNYPAHIRLDSNNQYVVQSVEKHCKNTANIAKKHIGTSWLW